MRYAPAFLTVVKTAMAPLGYRTKDYLDSFLAGVDVPKRLANRTVFCEYVL